MSSDRDVTPCPATGADGLPCQKRLYRARNGEDWDHAGGHMFAADRTWELLTRGHFDAGAVLAGRATPAHLPEACAAPGDCPDAH